MALGGVDPDHVPEDRLAADLDQRLGDRVRLLLQAGPAPAAEDRDRDVGALASAATGDGGQDRHLVAVGERRVEAVLKADVLAGDVDVDEAPQRAVLGDPLAQVARGRRRPRRAPRRPSSRRPRARPRRRWRRAAGPGS